MSGDVIRPDFRPRPRGLPRLDPITVKPIVPESEDFYRTATEAEWRARMAEKYGPDFDGPEAA